ncbi:hypothetical protein IQ260_29060, partial [Leptolyngbya cf. ectocarpi LEGE 11479]
MSSKTWTNRIVWPETNRHWEIRKGFTIKNYSSFELDRIIKLAEEESYRPNFSSQENLDFLFQILYENSCIETLETQFDFYQIIFKPSEYRRTSEDFKMKGNRSLEIGAFVNIDTPDTIWINDGIVLAL